MENRTKVSNGTIFSDLQRLSEIFTATKHRPAPLRQLSFLLSRVSTLTRDIDIAILSVRLSVRDVSVGLSDENGLTYCHSFFHHTTVW